MFIEMGIRQVQQKETPQKHLSPDTFISDAKAELENNGSSNIPATLFTGPMTIRIHEADGTPYEHIVDLKEGFTKLDIQYNTKYKRLKRSQKQLRTEKEQREAAEDDDNILLHCLGDNLQTEKEIKEWELTEWSKEEEDKMTNEAFEWIRVDADFEWICKIHINQPDYMYSSQLQQDRDVEAQLESISYFANSNPSPLYSTILLRTLMDPRYYYGVRVEAAYGMAKFAKEQVNWIGSKHLLMAFKELFCFPNSTIPSPNNFQDFPLYFIRKAIPLALSTTKDSQNNCPLEIKKVLLNILKYNQNLDNPYSDTYYIGQLIQCLVNALVSNPLIDNPNKLNDKDRAFLEDAISEITRHQKLEEWTHSSKSGSVSSVALKEKVRLLRTGLFKFDPEDLLTHTKSQFTYDTRVTAFEALFSMGALKNEPILKYFFSLLTFEESLYFKHQLITTFSRTLGYAVIEGVSIDLDEDELTKEVSIDKKTNNINDGLIVVQEGVKDQFESRRDAAARATLKGAANILRRDFGEYLPLKNELWAAVRQPLFSVLEKRDLFEIVEVLVPAYDKFLVNFDTPRERKIKATNLGDGKISLKRAAPFKVTINKKLLVPLAPGAPAAKGHSKSHSRSKSITKPIVIKAPTPVKPSKYKAEIRKSKTGPLRYVKISQNKKMITISSDPLRRSKKVGAVNGAPSEPKIKSELSAARIPYVVQPTTAPKPLTPILSPKKSAGEPPKPKLKLKFKF
jgi:transcription initiation factor TFIID subunit 2